MSHKIYTYNNKKKSSTSNRAKGNRKKIKSTGRKKSAKKSFIQRLKITMSFGVMVGLLIGIMILYGIQYATIEKNLVEIRQLKKELVYLESKNTAVKVDIKRLENVNRIYDMASRKLGMVPAGEAPLVLKIDKEELEKAKQKDLVKNG